MARPTDNSDPLAENNLEDNGVDMDENFPPLDDVCGTIPEEASEELREEEEAEAAALEAARDSPDSPVIAAIMERAQKPNE